MPGIFGAVWGLSGVMILLISAVYRLSIPALEIFNYKLLWYQWVILILNVFFFTFVKGYLGFQRGFSPRVAARARYLKEHTVFINSILAPLFCMGYFKASRKRKIIAVSLTTAIIIMIILVRKLPQPWRGIIDFGVIAGLLWGIVSLIVFGYRAFFKRDFEYSPEVVD
ncbi:hypothetical protein HY745_08880 [Candidatus Desantisbacteria bacterium]|nr:hypothetical protein [Candidatus Desantisbacteria bacterium]